MQTYVMRSGDTLYSIAAKFYGNGALWPRIAAANGLPTNNAMAPELLTLQPGLVLNIPSLNDSSPDTTIETQTVSIEDDNKKIWIFGGLLLVGALFLLGGKKKGRRRR